MGLEGAQAKGGETRPHSGKNSYLIKFIYWESGYLINILTRKYFFKYLIDYYKYVTYE